MELYINNNGVRFDVFWKSGKKGWFVRTHHANGLKEMNRFQSHAEAMTFIGSDARRVA